MATMTARGYVIKDVIGAHLQRIMKGLAGGKVISGSISVAPGHEYWWFLEYGTGAFHEAPLGELNPPRGTALHAPAGGPYEIQFKRQRKRFRNLVYMLKSGQRRRANAVIHPGIKPLGFIRTSMFKARLELAMEVKKRLKNKRRGMPTRDELVDIVNDVLLQLHQRLIIKTPDDSDPDPFHEHRPHDPALSESWIVTFAK